MSQRARRTQTQHARVSTLVRATPEHCYSVADDISAYPEWAPGISAVEVLELDDQGAVLVARFDAAAIGRRTRYELKYERTKGAVGQPLRLAWSQVRGDLTTRVDGAYTFAVSADDPDSTKVTYELSIALAVPLPGFVKRRAEEKIVAAALGRFRSRAEALYEDIR